MTRNSAKTKKGSTQADAPEPESVDQQSADSAEQKTGELSELEVLQREVEELRDKNLRVLAESRNLQQRAQRDKAEALKYAEADFARELLVVLDDLERTRESAGGATDARAVVDGVRIVYEHFLKVLKGRGIEPIEALGKPFDPGVHEAIMQQASDERAAGIVMQEVARGYKMHDRVLRPSRVIVSSGPAASDAEGESEE